MNLKFITALCVCLSISFVTFAQVNDTVFWNGKKLIAHGELLHNSAKYDDALRFYSRVSSCDPLYPTACYESALTLEAKSEYLDGLKKIIEADSLQPNNATTIILKGSLLDDLERYQESIELLESARLKWPYNQNLLYNLAIVYANISDYNKAEQLLEQSIKLSPYHAGSHILLGRINYFMGRLPQSYLAFNMGLLLNPSNNNITKFENVITGVTKPSSDSYLFPYLADSDDTQWNELNRFCKSGLAFRKDFPYEFQTNYLMNRQSFMLFKLMEYNPTNKSIYNQFYVRFFKDILNRNELDVFFAYQMQNSENSKVKDWLKSNASKKKKFIEFAESSINTWREYGFSADNENRKVKTHFYTDNGAISLIGTEFQEPKPSLEGEYIRIGVYGEISEKGIYKNNEVNGSCTIFWSDGKIKQDLNFVNGNFNGINKTFYKNGNISGIFPRDNNKKEGTEQEFTLSGRVFRKENYINGKAEGISHHLYTISGFSSESTYKNGKLQGPYKEKWLNGVTKTEANYTDSLLNGTMKNFYSNAKLESVYEYKNNISTGPFKVFHSNGIIKKEGTYSDSGELQGVLTEYDRLGGKIMTQTGYEKGILNGTQIDYYSNGAKKNEYQYLNNKVQKIICYNPNGSIRYQAEEKNGSLAFKSFYNNGIVNREGTLVNGKPEGEWLEYSACGVVNSVENWKDNMQTGIQKRFYPSGVLKTVYTCDSNLIHGSYIEYHPNASKKAEVVYNKGEADGEVKLYYSNGVLSSKYYLENNELTGRRFDYTVEGKIAAITTYNDENAVTSESLYHNNSLVKTISYLNDSVLVEIPYPNTKVMSRFTLVDGLKHGVSESFYPNGKLREKQFYMYGKLNGPSKQWDINGNLKSYYSYNLNKLEGFAYNYEDAKLERRSYFEENEEQIDFRELYPNGKVFRLITYVDGERVGPSSFFSPDSVMLFVLDYDYGSVGAITVRNKQGEIEKLNSSVVNAEPLKSYYPNGTLAAIIPFSKGIMNGKLTLFYPNGNIQRERMYVNDYIEGVTTNYYQNGKLKNKEEYVNNDLTGKYTAYSESGIKQVEGQYISDLKIGTWIYYDVTGKQKFKVEYENDLEYEIK